jgi:hypothetical protein
MARRRFTDAMLPTDRHLLLYDLNDTNTHRRYTPSHRQFQGGFPHEKE